MAIWSKDQLTGALENKGSSRVNMLKKPKKLLVTESLLMYSISEKQHHQTF